MSPHVRGCAPPSAPPPVRPAGRIEQSLTMESSPDYRPVQPVRPPAPYIGGKRNLARRLVEIIDRTPCHTYAEVFGGMGGVFLRRRRAPRAEVINDWSREVTNLFRVLQVHYVAFLDMLRFQITSRPEFERLVATDPGTLTDMQRAARFLYLQRTAYGGKVEGRNFGVDVRSRGAFDVTRLQPLLEEVHLRLAGVVIERLPWEAFLPRYDRPDTLFYLDPPYFGSEDDYGKGMFPRADFERLEAALKGLQGRFILSINDTPEIRELFGRFELQEVRTSYGINGGQQPARELIISGP
jgi:DNA adenine methylase